ncbi:hypothetical protein [Glycomyces buryatensis]|uniref:Uncharacterized protein n=1 Tax=Glycomyces buryatensis TaxID=2570927 RepID=A0A4S8QBT0_9ACTN|nr:hypothetical protein [Glycomyces buryatensis]THV41818.1 hypothetical protein FAB82_09635 [Glycomyces buryatensis]
MTDDPEKLAYPHRRSDAGADSKELAEFAVTLGLTPPGRPAGGKLPLIAMVWPAGEATGLLVWDIHEMEEADREEGRH